jgi:hypothetical protein
MDDPVSRPSGDEEVDMSTVPSGDHEARRRAAAAGRAAERAVASVLDRLEGLSLWALEQAAECRPQSGQVRSAETRLNHARRMTAPLPRNANRLVAASTYFASRWAPEALSSAREALRETSAFLEADQQPVVTDTDTDTKSADE